MSSYDAGIISDNDRFVTIAGSYLADTPAKARDRIAHDLTKDPRNTGRVEFYERWVAAGKPIKNRMTDEVHVLK